MSSEIFKEVPSLFFIYRSKLSKSLETVVYWGKLKMNQRLLLKALETATVLKDLDFEVEDQESDQSPWSISSA